MIKKLNLNSTVISEIIDIMSSYNFNKEKKLGLFKNPFQKWAVLSSLIFYMCFLIFMIIFKIIKVEWMHSLGLFFLAISWISGCMIFLSPLFKEIINFEDPIKIFLREFNLRVQKEIPFILKFDFSKKKELEFLANRLKFECREYKQTSQLLFGNTTSLGILSFTITSFILIFKLHFTFNFSLTIFLSFVSIVLYIMSVFATLLRLKKEKLQFFLSQAVLLCKESEKINHVIPDMGVKANNEFSLPFNIPTKSTSKSFSDKT